MLPQAAPSAPRSAGYLRVHPGFFEHAECVATSAGARRRGFARADTHYPPSYRSNARQVYDAPELAAALHPRLSALAPPELRVAGDDGAEERWRFAGLNPRFRFCRYAAGEAFHIHRDGPHAPSAHTRSLLSVLVYLSDPAAFEGGATEFFAAGPAQPGPPSLSLRPARGSLLLFDHALWHAGARVTAGEKLVLRSDVLYTRGVGARVSTADGEGHCGYVWSLLDLGGGAYASGGRDGTIRLWGAGGEPRGTLHGHRQSVLGLARDAAGKLWSVGRDQQIRVWDLAARACVVALPLTFTPLSICALPSGAMAVGGADHTILLLSEAGARMACLRGHAGWVWSVASSADRQLWSASEDGSVRLWDPERATCVHTLEAGAPLRCLAFDGVRGRLAAGDSTGAIHVFDTRGAPRLLWRSTVHRAAVRSLGFCHDGSLVSGGEDGAVIHTRGRDGAPTCTRIGAHTDFVASVLLRQGFPEPLSAGYDGHICRHAAPDRRDALSA